MQGYDKLDSIELIKNDSLREQLRELCHIRDRHAMAEKVAKEEKDLASEAIISIMKKLKVGSFKSFDHEGEERIYILSQGTSVVIKKILLINQGVDPDKIDAATERKLYYYVQSRKPNADASQESNSGDI